MGDVEYAFLRVIFVATGFGHNDHGSFPTGAWHLALWTGSAQTELEKLPGPLDEIPASAVARGLTKIAAEGWRAEETVQFATVIAGNWRADGLLIRVARISSPSS